MERIEDIEAAIDRLPPDQFRSLAEWFQAREQRLWDEQLAHDSRTGKLDALFAEADTEKARGLLRDWPPRP